MALNLDWVAAECAQEMVRRAPADKVENLERLATKTLGVLQEQGVYAALLFLFSRTSDEKIVAPFVRAALYAALARLPGFEGNPALAELIQRETPAKALAFFSGHVLQNLDTTLLVRDLYEQALIYTRYGAKAAAPAKGG